jgi:hypothetical protein
MIAKIFASIAANPANAKKPKYAAANPRTTNVTAHASTWNFPGAFGQQTAFS